MKKKEADRSIVQNQRHSAQVLAGFAQGTYQLRTHGGDVGQQDEEVDQQENEKARQVEGLCIA